MSAPSTRALAPLRRVVVTGIGAVTPLGSTFPSTWSALTGQRSTDDVSDVSDHDDVGATTFERALLEQDLSPSSLDREMALLRTLPCQVAAPVRGVGRGDGRVARFARFAEMAGAEAAGHAGLDEWLRIRRGSEEDEDENDDEEIRRRRDRSGCSVGSGMSSVRDVSSSSMECYARNSVRRLSPHFVPRVLTNSATARLALSLKLSGPNLTSSTACAAGAHAIGDAYRCVKYGDADVMVAGGAEACLDPISAAGFCRLRALSTGYNDVPWEASRPFDAGRDGFVMGEGAAVLVLEELEHARRRGANILCEAVGYGMSGDAYHITSPDPEGRGAVRAMTEALRSAGTSPGSVDYVNAHATSTPVGDDIEARAIDAALVRSTQAASEREQDLYVSSTKGTTGHLLGAAGGIEAAFAVMAIAEGTVPHTPNLSSPSGGGGESGSDVGFRHVTERPLVGTDIRVAVSNSFGFGGTNASLVFMRYDGDDKDS